jgi:hypothetical protein
MDFSAGSMIASMIVSTIGGGFFMYGKKQSRLPQVVTGLVLIGFPYFVGDVTWMIAIAVAVIIGLWAGLRAGW